MLPLIMVLAIIILLLIIVFAYSLLESVVYTKCEELKIRRTIKRIVKDNCNKLEDSVNGFFDDLINGCFEELNTNNRDEEL